MFGTPLIAEKPMIWLLFLVVRVLFLSPYFLWSGCCRKVTPGGCVPEDWARHPTGLYDAPQGTLKQTWLSLNPGKHGSFCFHGPQHDARMETPAGQIQLTGLIGESQKIMLLSEEGSLSSSAPPGPWSHSLYSSFTYVSNVLHLRNSRNTLTRQSPQHSLPLVQNVASPSPFWVKFQKCGMVNHDADSPQLTFFLLIHNIGPVGGTNLSQVVIRDSVSGLRPIRTEGRVVEKGFQTFTIDSLQAGSHIAVNYTAVVRSHKSEFLDLPAFLTFSNASQNDVSMFGPFQANLTLRVNSTDEVFPNHQVHFCGFVGGFFVTLVLLALGFLAKNLTGSRQGLSLLQARKSRDGSDYEYADCSMSEAVKDEAAFEDKIVDVMVLEEPPNMYQALDNLEMSTLLHATSRLELIRIHVFKDIISCLLGGLQSRGLASAQAQQRLLSVLHGQLLGMEGRLKEDLGARMAALAGQCNLETREEMEAEHHRVAAEKAQAERLCKHAEQQELLQCSILLEKLHKLSQSRLQRMLLVRHEEASAKVQRQVIEWRRMELHKIFSEELEEATRVGELKKSTATSLQHEYFTTQEELEKVLDVVLARQRYILSERSAQRKFLVHSLHSLNSLISDTFSFYSTNLDCWFDQIRRGSLIPTEQMNQLQEKVRKELVIVRQRLEETLNQERRAMRCGLIKRRRELISDLVMVHRRRQKELSSMSRDQDVKVNVTQRLHSWQNLMTTHNSELAELINNMDEEAAADIRKMTMRLIQGAVADVKAIQTSAIQALQAVVQPGTKLPPLQLEQEGGANALLQGQERLHQEGKAALHTLSYTRRTLQQAMEKELQEQKELREQCKDFFRHLCLSQLSLSEDDRLKMKLEFQKCLSVLDCCLVLPHAVSRAKLRNVLAARRNESGEQRIRGKTSDSKKKPDSSDVLLFQRSLEERLHLFEREKELETSLMTQVSEDMQRENWALLLSRTNELAVQMAAVHYQKAERWVKLLETYKAVLTLQSLLIQLFKERKHLKRDALTQSIQTHCKSLEEAEELLQIENDEEEKKFPSGVKSSKSFQDVCGKEEQCGKDELFQMDFEAMMTSILQEALHKREQVIAVLGKRYEALNVNSQSREDLNEQIQFKRLYSLCDQDLEFASQLVKQSQVSVGAMQEALRLLLPTLPESELLALSDVLSAKQSASGGEEHLGFEELNRDVSIKLQEDVVQKNMPNTASCAAEKEKLQEKRQSLMEKLLPRSNPSVTADCGTSPVEEKRKQEGLIKEEQPAFEPVTVEKQRVAEVDMSPVPADSLATGDRLFVFRDPPEPSNGVQFPKKQKKRNFLNLKKSSVAPANVP